MDRTIPIEDTWRELAKLQKEGKVKYLGISEATSEEIRRAHAIAPISAYQIEVSQKFPCISARTEFMLSSAHGPLISGKMDYSILAVSLELVSSLIALLVEVS